MKIVFSTFIFWLLATGIYGQSFELVDYNNSTYKGAIGKQIKAPIRIKNLTDKPIQIMVRRIEKVIGTSQTNFFCWDGECYDANIDELPLSKYISPGETSDKFESILETGLVSGISSVKYLIYNRDNPTDAIEYKMNYTVEERTQSNILFNSPELIINEVYPNPVKEYAIIDYNVYDQELKAKIVLHNVLGSVVGGYDLPYLKTKLKINTEDFNPGVYFYTLYIDNDAAFTRKLIIRQ
ncbi:T9SS type A sorting domain-containing protein [Fulvivirga sp. M361]|uniref:T9SS type A sorting domain-containing protein n=1 Tax=Fulvivirga sp. M361 TaxID=2594266 RepID=UPI00117BA8C1|nr:T9SS type A sorting domain-containing protein [Fulvivirga sp. M361]TRX52015.1 T9SS type A sorting domain-containing protein [Fulvivirga sp. M361]